MSWELLAPLLIADAVLLWMLRDAWRGQQVWQGTRMGRKADDPMVWWMAVGRIGILLALALTGTIVVLLD